MKPNEYEILQAAAAGGRTVAWFEAPERLQTTNDLLAWGYIAKVDLLRPHTGAEPRHYRATNRGRALWEGAKTWKAAKSVALPEGCA